MKIELNSRSLTADQQSRIEAYFLENPAFHGFRPRLDWKPDASAAILLGKDRDFVSVAVRLHERNLLGIAGRTMLQPV